MESAEHFDFWYAVHNTRIIHSPSSRLETFGATTLNYHLVTELMDSVRQIKIREGRVEAYRPTIITPQSFAETILEGFGQEAGHYAAWLREHARNLRILKYGFSVRKQDLLEETVTGNLEDVAERVRADVEAREDPLGAVLVGVDKPWEVCLLKLMVDVVEKSVQKNIGDLRRQPGGLDAAGGQDDARAEIERDFAEAAKDRRRINALGAKLQKLNLFSEYEDRFYALVRKHG